MEEEFILLAYHKWLLRESNKDKLILANFIHRACMDEQNPLAFDLLEATGDSVYTTETFYKAADILLNADQR